VSTRRATPGGWVDRRSHPRQCRWCAADVPKGRYTFCSQACVHAWKLRTDPAYLREQVFQRDRGVCAACGLDTESLRRKRHKLTRVARKQFEQEWGKRRTLWDADHIVPVAEGGGECDLSNMRTLCLKCHRQATADLLRRLGMQPRQDAEELRAQLFARDRGVCAACGVDTEAVRKHRRTLDYAARRQFEKEWGKDANLWLPASHGATLCVKCLNLPEK
jgi:5-methylcytosine-specific restriction protein A